MEVKQHTTRAMPQGAGDVQLAKSTTLNYFRHAGQWNGVFFAPASSAKTLGATVRIIQIMLDQKY